MADFNTSIRRLYIWSGEARDQQQLLVLMRCPSFEVLEHTWLMEKPNNLLMEMIGDDLDHWSISMIWN